MSIEALISQLKEEHYGQKIYDPDFEGTCPCADGDVIVDNYPVHFWSRCWRVSDNAQDLYVFTDHPKIKTIAKAVKKNLDAQEWYNPYTIITGKYAEKDL